MTTQLLQEINIVKVGSIKRTIKDNFQMRASTDAVEGFSDKLNKLIENILQSATELAKNDKRSTIMQDDLNTAIAQNIGQSEATVQEVLESLKSMSATDLGKIVKNINEHIVALKQ